MPRVIDEAKALNDDLQRMRRAAGALVAELEGIVRALCDDEDEGYAVEPPWLETMAREISGAVGDSRSAPSYDAVALAALGLVVS